MARTGRCSFMLRKLFSYFRISNIVIRRNAGTVLAVPFNQRHPLTSTVNHQNNLCFPKNFRHDDCDSGSDSDEPSNDISDLYSETEVKENIESLLSFLYPHSSDPVILQLNACASVQDVFDTIRMNESLIDGKHASQAVLVLWDLQKIFVSLNSTQEFQSSVEEQFRDSEQIVTDYMCKINHHPDFEVLLDLVERHADDMSADAVTCTLLYLNKMGVHINRQVMQKLVSCCEKLIDRMGSDFPLTALSRFTVAVGRYGGLWMIFVLQKVVPIIISKLETCNDADDLRLLTIGLNNIQQLVELKTLETYKSRVLAMLENGSLTSENNRTIVKAVLFLNSPHWAQYNTDTVRLLLKQFRGKISSLDPRDLVAVHKTFQSTLEPADMLEEIQKHAAHILSKEGDFSNAVQNSVDLLSCVVSFSSPSQRKLFEKLTYDHMENSNFSLSMVSLFKVIRSLKTSNVQLCDAFWSNILKSLEQSAEERADYELLKQCHRYMYFNNNLGGSYRHYNFEKKVIQWLLEEVNEGVYGIIPSKLARAASFIIAYGDSTDDATLKLVIDKLTEMAPQLTETDCLSISRGFQIAMQLRHHKIASQSTMRQIVRLDGLLNDCARLHLKKKHHSLTWINLVMRTYLNRKGSKESDIFEELIDRYEHFEGVLSSRSIREVAFNFQMTGCLVPAVVDRLVGYVIEQNGHLLGETMEKILYLCYSLGYSPAQADTFLSVASDVILRDKTRLTGLSLLQAALALSYFNHLREDLVHFIFTVDFLEQLDEEISHCYSKATYPLRVRHTLMQLNRAVCLDYPELDIPWFHQKYCQEIAALEPVQISSIHADVKKTLVEVLGGREFVKADVYSPYGYKIDFQILLDSSGNPVHMRHQNDKNVTRLAVLLHKEEDFCSNVSSLKGPLQLKQRHLEMLGYLVLKLSLTLWNSMYMAEPRAKQNHVQKLIWPMAMT